MKWLERVLAVWAGLLVCGMLTVCVSALCWEMIKITFLRH